MNKEHNPLNPQSTYFSIPNYWIDGCKAFVYKSKFQSPHIAYPKEIDLRAVGQR